PARLTVVYANLLRPPKKGAPSPLQPALMDRWARICFGVAPMPRDGLGLVLDQVRKLVSERELDRLTDRELLKCYAKKRDAEAFSVLVQRHGLMVFHVCRRLLYDSHDVEDVFQAAFLILMRRAGSHKWEESVGHWLHLVAYRLALRVHKNARRRLPLGSTVIASTGADPMAEVSGRELCAVLDEELSRLPAKYRMPLVLCCLEGFARDEAARQCGLSLDQLKRRLARGRVLLRQRLARRGFTLSAVFAAALWTEKSSASALPGSLVQRVGHS